jgi:hypothetical protein
MAKPRVCPYCLHIETDAVRITAVFNGRRKDHERGGCSCHACDGTWEEYAYRNGRTMLKLRNGRMVDEDELRRAALDALGDG